MSNLNEFLINCEFILIMQICLCLFLRRERPALTLRPQRESRSVPVRGAGRFAAGARARQENAPAYRQSRAKVTASVRTALPAAADLFCAAVLRYSIVIRPLPLFLRRPGNILRCLMIAAVLTLVTGYRYRRGGRKLMLAGVCAYMVQHMAFALRELLLIACRAVPVLQGAAARGTVLFYAVGIVIAALTIALSDRLFFRFIAAEESSFRTETVVALSAAVLANILVFSEYANGLTPFQLFLFRLLSVNTCLFAFVILRMLTETGKLRDELAFAQKLSDLWSDYYEGLRSSLEYTNIRAHDLKHQISAVRAAKAQTSGRPAGDLSGILSGAPETSADRRRYVQAVQELQEAITVYDQTARTGCAPLDVVLTDKAAVCRGLGIRFVYMADPDSLSGISERDLYALFGNILDNAIEAARRLSDPEKRVIHLNVQTHGAMTLIREYNYYTGLLSMKDGLPETTREKAEGHGYGMKSIRLICEKYGGGLSVSAQDDIFELDLMIPTPAPAP